MKIAASHATFQLMKDWVQTLTLIVAIGGLTIALQSQTQSQIAAFQSQTQNQIAAFQSQTLDRLDRLDRQVYELNERVTRLETLILESVPQP